MDSFLTEISLIVRFLSKSYKFYAYAWFCITYMQNTMFVAKYNINSMVIRSLLTIVMSYLVSYIYLAGFIYIQSNLDSEIFNEFNSFNITNVYHITTKPNQTIELISFAITMQWFVNTTLQFLQTFLCNLCNNQQHLSIDAYINVHHTIPDQVKVEPDEPKSETDEPKSEISADEESTESEEEEEEDDEEEADDDEEIEEVAKPAPIIHEIDQTPTKQSKTLVDKLTESAKVSAPGLTITKVIKKEKNH
jgi:hypothetical protein